MTLNTTAPVATGTAVPARSSGRPGARPRAQFAAFITPLVLAVAGWVVALAPAPAQAATESRSLPEFQSVVLQAGIDVNVRQGDTPSLTLTAEDSMLKLLETVVEPGSKGPTLVLRFARGSRVYSNTPVRADLVMPRLQAFSVMGSGDVRLEPFNTPALQLSVAGSGDVTVKGLTTEDLQVSVAGSGDVRGSGSARRLKVNVAGSGDVRLTDLRAENVAVSIAGSGDVAVQAQTTLDISIVGSGDVQYTGAARVKQSVTGSGSIVQR